MTSRSEFKLFRSFCSAPNAPQYVGGITTPEGKHLLIEAWVVEHDIPPQGKGKHFEGRCFYVDSRDGRAALTRGARVVEGDLTPQQVLGLDKQLPFNDPLPEDM